MLELKKTMNHKESKSQIVSKNTPRDLREGLEKSNILLSNHETIEALQLLLNLNKKYPHNPKILELMAFAYIDLKNDCAYLETMLEWDKLVSGNEFVKHSLAEAYLNNNFQMLALQTYRKTVNRWPNGNNSEFYRNIVHQLEQLAAQIADKLDLPLEKSIDFFAKHEKLQILMYQGKFNQCKKIAGDLLSISPEFTPVRNNLSQIYWQEGNLSEAIETTKKVLDFQPENVHALSALCCYFFMRGEKKNVAAVKKRLRESKILATDHWYTKVKAFSFVGDDDGVINLLEQAKLDENFKFIDGTFWHWCAVAEYRKGNLSKARAYWKKCFKLAPYFSLASDNLEELNKPIFDRNCPQAFGLDTWIPRKIIKDLLTIFDHASSKKENNDVKEKLDSYINEHPEILEFIPAAISAGDTTAIEFALQLADMTFDQKTLNWLKVYALGKEGSDSTRMKAAQILASHGVFKTGEKIKLWTQGCERAILIFGFEIVSGSMEKDTLKPAARDLAGEAIDALREKNGKLAEEFLRKAIKIQPDEPTLLNNLAVSLNLQGKTSEAIILADQIEMQYPEYFFSQIIAARKAIIDKNFNKAQLILEKLMNKDKIHITEFSALCSCQIDLNMANKNLESALFWLETWEGVYPEDPLLENYRDIQDIAK